MKSFTIFLSFGFAFGAIGGDTCHLIAAGCLMIASVYILKFIGYTIAETWRDKGVEL